MDSGNLPERKSRGKKGIYSRITAFLYFVLLLFLLNIQSAASDPGGQNISVHSGSIKEAVDPFAPLGRERTEILKSAFSLQGKATESTIKIMGESICLDCIGTVLAVYLQAGYDYRERMNGDYGGGVRNLYAFLKDNGAIYTAGLPRPGDIVFWDNTWDANGDGDNSNDLLTHAGIVIKVEENGTVHYLHAHIRKGIIVQKMNRYTPEYYSETGEVINNAMALNSGPGRETNPEKWTSGQLWAAYGSILDVIRN